MLAPVQGAGGIRETEAALSFVRLWRALGGAARASGAEAVAKSDG